MTSFSKTALALLLLACGFIAAKTFGPPDLAERLVQSWRPEPGSAYGDLQPATPDEHHTDFLPPLEMMNPPAGFQPSPPQVANRNAAEVNSYWAAKPTTTAVETAAMPAMPTTAWSTPAKSWREPQTDPGLMPSSYEQEMTPLRPASAPNGGDAYGGRSTEWGAEWSTPPAQPASGYTPAQPTSQSWGSPAGQPTNQSYWEPAAPITSAVPAHEASFGGPPTGSAGFDNWSTPSLPPAPTQMVSADDWADAPLADLQPLTPIEAPSEAAEARTHIVADGDSLTRLAERYLGDGSRSTEIYEKNRELLTHPELLPLGVELKLP